MVTVCRVALLAATREFSLCELTDRLDLTILPQYLTDCQKVFGPSSKPLGLGVDFASSSLRLRSVNVLINAA